MIWQRIFGRRTAGELVTPSPDGFTILEEGQRLAPAPPSPVTCAEAGRDGYYTRKAIESARYRATAIALAEKIGRPDLAEKLRP